MTCLETAGNHLHSGAFRTFSKSFKMCVSVLSFFGMALHIHLTPKLLEIFKINVCVNGKQKSSIKTNRRSQNVAKFIP